MRLRGLLSRSDVRYARSVLILLTTALAMTAVGAANTDAQPSAACTDGKLRVGIDIGHSRQHFGATSASGKPEYRFNARFAEELVALSRRMAPNERAVELFIHNPGGGNVRLSERPANAKRLGADVLLSIHHDSAQKRYLIAGRIRGTMRQHAPKIRGYSLFVSSENTHYEDSRRLATLIGRSFRIARMVPTGHHAEDIPGERRLLLDRELGVYDAPFTVIASAGMPAVLLEIGVIINKDEERELERPEYRARIQIAVIEALAAYCAGHKP